VLSGHTDVVPVEAQAWTSDPWRLTERDGRLFGRGTCDMKGFVALALVAASQAAGRRLARPLHLALSYDEEVGCQGAPAMVTEMARVLPAPDAVIVGEPSGMRVVSGHKSSLSFFTNVTGHTVHASQVHKGVSAVMTAARLVTWFEDRLTENQARADASNGFDPPYTTLHCGTIQGGTAANVVSASCSFVTDIRAVPTEDARDYQARYTAYVREVIEPRMQAVAPSAGIEIVHRGFVPGLRPVPDSSAEAFVRRLTGDNATHVVAYGTEAGIFQNAGWATVVCGPGDIAQAHQADEYLTLAEFMAGERFLAQVVDRLTA